MMYNSIGVTNGGYCNTDFAEKNLWDEFLNALYGGDNR